jgi:hypothetical protein
MDATGGNKRDDTKTDGIIDKNKQHDGQNEEQQQLESLASTSKSTSASISISKIVEEEPKNNSTAAALIPLFEMDTEFGYHYRDFSNIPEKELNESQSSNIPVVPRGTAESIRVQKFPLKLYAILAQNEFQDIIAWMPHGRSWKVHKPNLFETRIMPMFFEYSNYHSFNRLVNAWSFRRVSSGVDRGSYYHEVSRSRVTSNSYVLLSQIGRRTVLCHRKPLPSGKSLFNFPFVVASFCICIHLLFSSFS